ncbi:MAG: hypothetical protein IPN08_16005 [Bacteroidales bacterium]|nr:hypothetical protein [Bacteroidales bacterium]
MKKINLIIGLLAALILGGCNKDESAASSGIDSKVIIGEIFRAGMAWNEDVKSMEALKSTYPINIGVDHTLYGPEGGVIHVLGSVTGSMSIDDQTGSIQSGFMQLGLTETINDYTMIYNGNTYTMDGAPYISLTGTFTLAPGGTTFGTASSMQIGGGFRVTGPGLDQTINIQLTIIINADGSGGHVSGTYGGEGVDYTF